MNDVTVIGAGVVGASVAYHLARAGVAVTVVERAPRAAAGVTGNSFAWVGEASGQWPGIARRLRPSVRADFLRLEAEVPGFAVRWSGSVAWGDDAVAQPGQSVIGADEVATLEPGLRELPERAVHTPTDGGIDPVAMVESLLDGARAHGARVVYGGAAARDLLDRGQTVVVAAGSGSPAVCEQFGVRLEVGVRPACRARVAAPPGLVRGILAGPEFEVREVRDGEVLMTVPHTAGQSDQAVSEAVRRAFQRLQASFEGAGSCRLLDHRVSDLPMPAQGPIIGPVEGNPRVYVGVMHSAITLAPTAGRLIAEEIVTGNRPSELRS